MNVSDLMNVSPAQRNADMRDAGQPTHLGPARPWAIEGYVQALRQQERRRPTHKGAAK